MCSILLPFGRNVLIQLISKSQTTLIRRPFAYQSSLASEKLYPNSSPKLVTVNNVPVKKDEEFSGYIPIKKLDITYCLSSGPGGQNINKVHTKVDLRFKISEADWLNESYREKLRKQHPNKINKEGYFIIKSELTRSQQLNLADCMRKLRDILRNLADPPEASPATIEMIRRRFEKSARERLRVKRHESQLRAMRQPPTINDL